jgi:hypothetical protein
MSDIVSGPSNVISDVQASLTGTIIIDIIVPIVIVLNLCLSPGIGTSKLFGCRSSDIPTRPLRARGEAKVNGLSHRA